MRSLVTSLLALVLCLPAAAQTAHLGEQRVIMLACYTEPSPPVGAAQLLVELGSMMDDAARWNAENSYDFEQQSSATTWNWDVYGWYSIPDSTSIFTDLQNAVAAALADGKVIGQGDRLVLVQPSDPAVGPDWEQQAAYQSLVNVPGQGFSVYLCWVYGNFTSIGDLDYDDVDHAIKHESAHTYRANHAQMESSVSGVLRAYGNENDTMGGEKSLGRHMQAAYKEWLGWMAPALTLTPGMSGQYVIAPLEIPFGQVPGTDAHALRIPLGESILSPFFGQYFYYVENRTDAASVVVDPDAVPPVVVDLEFDTSLIFNAADGALINRVAVASSAGSSPHGYGVDTTPETTWHSSSDCALMEGRSFFDPATGVCITNLGKQGENLRLEVNFVADFPHNRPPTLELEDVVWTHDPGDPRIVTFSAQASDPDAGDQLSYFWNFDVKWHNLGAAYQKVTWTGLPNYGAGAATTHTYPNTNARRAWVKASDRKGGESEWVEIPLWGWQPDIVTVVPGSTSIQAAIDTANAGAILELTDGVFSGSGNHDIRFTNQKRLTIRAAAGATPVIDCQGQGRGFIFDQQESFHCVLDGLTIRGGRKLSGSGYGLRGGAILLRSAARPVIRNCVFEDNQAVEGGAIYRDRVGRPRIESCVFRGNSATATGGAIHAAVELDAIPFQNADGGNAGRLHLVGNRFEGNWAPQGAALWLDEPSAFNRYGERSGIELADNEIVVNISGAGGWAVYFDKLRGRALLSSNTVARNLAGTGGGGLQVNDLRGDGVNSPTAFTNTVLWENSPADLGFDASHAWVQEERLRLRHCLTTDPFSGPPSSSGNISGDPRFTAPDAPSHDFTLSKLQSPCVDAGEWTPRVGTDRLGNERYDDPQVVNTGSDPLDPSSPIDYVDIGANERQQPSLAYWTGTPSLVLNARQSVQGSTVGYMCTGQLIFVGADYGTVTMTNRGFVDYSIPGTLRGDIKRVELDLEVFDGMQPWWSQVQARAMGATAASLSGDCAALWDSISTSNVYAQDLGFHQDLSTVRIDLGPDAADDLEAQLGIGGGWFSVGVRAANEAYDSMMELRNYGHRLHVYYVPNVVPGSGGL